MSEQAIGAASVFAACNCAMRCGDDGDAEGPGVCKGLPRQPEPPLVTIVMVPRARPGEPL